MIWKAINVIHAGSELTDSSWPLVALSCLQFYCFKLQIYIISISKIIEFEFIKQSTGVNFVWKTMISFRKRQKAFASVK